MDIDSEMNASFNANSNVSSRSFTSPEALKDPADLIALSCFMDDRQADDILDKLLSINPQFAMANAVLFEKFYLYCCIGDGLRSPELLNADDFGFQERFRKILALEPAPAEIIASDLLSFAEITAPKAEVIKLRKFIRVGQPFTAGFKLRSAKVWGGIAIAASVAGMSLLLSQSAQDKIFSTPGFLAKYTVPGFVVAQESHLQAATLHSMLTPAALNSASIPFQISALQDSNSQATALTREGNRGLAQIEPTLSVESHAAMQGELPEEVINAYLMAHRPLALSRKEVDQ